MLLIQGHLLPGRTRALLVVLDQPRHREFTGQPRSHDKHMTSSVLTPNLVFLIILQRTAKAGLWEQGWGVQGKEAASC